MAKQSRKAKRHIPKTVLRLPDLDQPKSAVLNNLTSVDAQRGYRHAIDEFVEWYIMQRANVGVIQCRHRPRFGGEPSGELGRGDLDGHVAIQPRISGLEDRSRPT